MKRRVRLEITDHEAGVIEAALAACYWRTKIDGVTEHALEEIDRVSTGVSEADTAGEPVTP